MEDHLYLVTYDIRSPKRWRQVFRKLHGFGEWLQLSVFQCRLDRTGYVELVAELTPLLNTAEDHLLIIDVGLSKNVAPKVRSLGKSFDPVSKNATIV